MELESRSLDSGIFLKPREKRIDAANAATFKSQLLDIVGQGNLRILIDLSEVDFMDSGGLGSLISVLKSLGKQGRIVIVGAKGGVLRLFEITRMNTVFTLSANEQDAIEALKK